MHRLRSLVAQGACRVMLEPVSSKALRSPAAIKAGEPVEEFHFRRRPTFPGELPVVAGDRSVEGSEVGGLGARICRLNSSGRFQSALRLFH